MARRRAMDWAVPADEGDAAAAVADIARWRGALPVPPDDFNGVMARVQDRLQLLWMSPLVRRDPGCAALFADMRFCRDMAEFEAGVTRLQARVAVLLGERGGAGEAVPPARAAAPAARTAPEPPNRRDAAAAWRSILKA